MFSVVSVSVPPPPPPPTEPVTLAWMGRLCKALCYCCPGKSYSPYLKTFEVDSPVKVPFDAEVDARFYMILENYPFGN